MAAKSKSELLNITQLEFTKLMKLVDTIDPEAAMKKRDEDTSVKDIVAHRAHWIDHFLGWYRHLNSDVKIGVGFEWGVVSDDLANINYENQGVFLNLVKKF